MSLWAELLSGLFAGGASCAASRAGCWPGSWPAAAASPSPSQRGGAPARGGRLPSLYRQRCGITPARHSKSRPAGARRVSLHVQPGHVRRLQQGDGLMGAAAIKEAGYQARQVEA